MSRRIAVAAGVLGAAWWWFRPFRAAVEGPSMRPTLDPGDFVIAARTARPRRGDVVVIRHPARPIAVVKRIVGLPGEHVRVERGRVEIGGASLHEPYAHGAGSAGEWRLGPGEHLVLGDERGLSTDGRSFGAIGPGAIEGVVWLRYWPRLTWLRGWLGTA